MAGDVLNGSQFPSPGDCAESRGVTTRLLPPAADNALARCAAVAGPPVPQAVPQLHCQLIQALQCFIAAASAAADLGHQAGENFVPCVPLAAVHLRGETGVQFATGIEQVVATGKR